jgi:hypothetical protein
MAGTHLGTPANQSQTPPIHHFTKTSDPRQRRLMKLLGDNNVLLAPGILPWWFTAKQTCERHDPDRGNQQPATTKQLKQPHYIGAQTSSSTNAVPNRKDSDTIAWLGYFEVSASGSCLDAVPVIHITIPSSWTERWDFHQAKCTHPSIENGHGSFGPNKYRGDLLPHTIQELAVRRTSRGFS